MKHPDTVNVQQLKGKTMFDYGAGFHAVMSKNDRPLKTAASRIFPRQHPLYDEEKWLEGYDAGLEAAKHYREGYAIGIANGPKTNDNDYWRTGWNNGRRIWLKKQIIPILKSAGKLKMMVCETYYPDYDHCEGIEHPGGEKFSPLKKSELLNACMEYLKHGDDTPKTMEEILKIFLENGESEFGNTRLLTVANYKKEKDEKEYKKIEKAAQRFASSCGKPMGTKEFIHALNKAVNGVRQQREQWNNPEVRHEQWAAHMYAGGGSETYFDDLNFENGRYEARQDDLRDVWNYLEKKFPIMMLRYKEAKARKKSKK